MAQKKFIRNKREKREKPILKTFGGTGTSIFSGFITGEEFNPALEGEEGLVVYDKMRKTDAQVNATLLAILLPLLQATWELEPYSDSNLDKEISAFVSKNLLEDMKIGWTDFLRQSLLFLSFGFMLFEKEYKEKDGKWVINNLLPRLPKSIFKWNVDAKNELLSVTQRFYSDNKMIENDIPVKNLVRFTHAQEGSNFVGVSVLRTAYKHWYIKDKLYRIDAMKHERFGLGIPEIQLPELASPGDMDKARDLGKGLRGHQQGYVITPFGFKVGLLQMTATGGSSVGTDIMPSIKHHNEEIAKNVLAQFINLGTTGSGSRSLGSSFQDMFLFSVQATANYIEDVVNKQVVRPLVDYNFEVKGYPSLNASKISLIKLKDLSDSLVSLVQNGIITPDVELEKHVRSVGNLPKARSVDRNVSDEEKEGVGVPVADDQKQKEETKKLSDRESGFWRELFPHEQTISLNEINKKTKEAEKTLNEIIDKFQKGKIEKLAKDIVENTGKAELTGEKELSALIEGELLDLFKQGKQEVKKEILKQRPDLLPVFEKRSVDEKEALEYIKNKAKAVTEVLLTRTKNSASLAELEVRLQGLTKEQKTQHVLSRLQEFTNSEAKKASLHSVLEIFGLGRNVDEESFKDEVAYANYSAILDENVCVECVSKDGTQHEVGDINYKTPNFRCFGTKNRCRCITIYTMKDESTPVV